MKFISSKSHFVLTDFWVNSPTHTSPKLMKPSQCPKPTNNIFYNIDSIIGGDEISRVRIVGWAYIKHYPSIVEIALVSQTKAYFWPAKRIQRPDVAQVMGTKSYDVGFWVNIDLSNLPNQKDKYQIGLMVTPNSKSKAESSTYVIHKVEDLDSEIEILKYAQNKSFVNWAPLRQGFSFYEKLSAIPKNPYSKKYRLSQQKLYNYISGINNYNPHESEPVKISLENSVDPYPYPFSTKDPEHIGNHFISIGHILRTLKESKPEGKSILEYGCGTGFTTIFLAASGFKMTAVDINSEALLVLEALAKTRKLKVKTYCGTFGQVPNETVKFDYVLFYEAFHHAWDFYNVLLKLHDRLTDDGVIIFAGEPIFSDFPKPWGLRLDGASLWEIRTRGWMELGFNKEFFYDLLHRTGWKLTNYSLPNKMAPNHKKNSLRDFIQKKTGIFLTRHPVSEGVDIYVANKNHKKSSQKSKLTI